MDDGYQSGGTPGGKWGCGLAVLVGVPLLGLLSLRTHSETAFQLRPVITVSTGC